MRRLTVLAVALILSFTAMPSAAAHGAGTLRGDTEGGSIPIFDPGAVSARCPTGFQWILETFGSGELTSDVYTGAFTYSGEHCSRWTTSPPDSADRTFPGRVGDGVLTVTTPEGILVLTYSGAFAFRGDVTLPEFTTKVWLRYQVDGHDSTGVFAGTSGRGVLWGNDQTGYQLLRLIGWLGSQG